MSSDKAFLIVGISTLTVLVFGLGGAYYCFQYRPAEIRKTCADEHLSYREGVRAEAGRLPPETSGLERYAKCLAEKGV